MLGPGLGDNAASMLGLAAGDRDAVVSVGTSGVACAMSPVPAGDPTGAVAGFADGTGRFLPLACTLNAAQVLDSTAALLGVDHAGLSDLALAAPAGAGGAVLVPYFVGERTPNLPRATASLHGLDPVSWTRGHLARATVEGLLCALADCLDALVAEGAQVDRVLLTGGGAASPAVRDVAPRVLGPTGRRTGDRGVRRPRRRRPGGVGADRRVPGVALALRHRAHGAGHPGPARALPRGPGHGARPALGSDQLGQPQVGQGELELGDVEERDAHLAVRGVADLTGPARGWPPGPRASRT